MRGGLIPRPPEKGLLQILSSQCQTLSVYGNSERPAGPWEGRRWRLTALDDPGEAQAHPAG